MNSRCLSAFVGVLSFAVAALSNPIKRVQEGDDAVLQCPLGSEVDVSKSAVTWSKDEHKNVIHAYTLGHDRDVDQMHDFRNRTRLFHEGLSKGNVTLQLKSVRPSDNGTYICYIPKQKTTCRIDLAVVKKGPLTRPQGNTTASPADEENTTVCSVKYTVISIFLGVLGFLILMIAGAYMFHRKIQRNGEMREAGRTNDAEMQTLRTETLGGGERPTNSASNQDV